MLAHFSEISMRDKVFSLCRFARNEAGVAAVEFALVALPLFALLFAIMEIGLFHFYSSNLQMAAEIASRELMIGSLAPQTTLQTFIDEKLCYTGGPLKSLFDCSKLRVEIDSPESWEKADVTNDYNAFGNNLEAIIDPPAPGRIGIVRIGYPLPELAGLIGAGNTGIVTLNGQRVRMIMGLAAFRVESS